MLSSRPPKTAIQMGAVMLNVVFTLFTTNLNNTYYTGIVSVVPSQIHVHTVYET
jgi:hypothetical protein